MNFLRLCQALVYALEIAVGALAMFAFIWVAYLFMEF